MDAGALNVEDVRLMVGVHDVNAHLLSYLTRYTDKYYRLYTVGRAGETVKLFAGERSVVVPVRPSFGWMHIGLPAELLRRPVDVFLGLSQALPWMPIFPKALPRQTYHRGGSRSFPRMVGFIYDLAFLYHPEAYPDSGHKLAVQTQHVARAADHIITISQATKRDIMHTYGISASRITVAYPGVSSRFSPFGPVYGHPRGYLLHVGSLKRSKNIPAILASYRRYRDLVAKPLDLILAGGDYWIDPEIASAVDRYRLKSSVFFPGHIDADTLPSLYRGARAFIALSLREGFCIPVAEAMASGVPVIVAKTGSLPEVAEKAGLVVDAGSPMQVAAAIRKAAAPSPFRDRMKAKGVKRASAFRWSSFGAAVDGVIGRLGQ